MDLRGGRTHGARPYLLQQFFGLDVRSMAAYRIALGLVLIGDLIDRAHDLRRHYTDDGMFPRSLGAHWGGTFWLNPYFLSGDVWFTRLLFLIHCCIALSLSLGIRTRLSMFLLWIFQVGLVMRNIMVGHGGDKYGGLFFVIAITHTFDAWSIDALLASTRANVAQGERKSTYYLSAATAGMLMQVSYVYVYAYYMKTHDAWVVTREATQLALLLGYFTEGMPFARFLLSLPPEALQFATAAVLAWEGWGPLFYFSPVLHGPLRLFGVIGFIALHVGFASALRLGSFFWISVAVQLALLPAWCWDSLLPRLRSSIPLLHRTALALETRLVTLSSSLLSQLLQGGLLSYPHPKPMRRPWWRRLWKLAGSLLVAFVIVAAVGWNITVLEGGPGVAKARWSEGFRPLASALGVDQNWGMFSPAPPDIDYWVVIRCTAPAGNRFELLREGGIYSMQAANVSFDVPTSWTTSYYNHRWLKYWESFVIDVYENIRPSFHKWLCREWNARYRTADTMIGKLEVWMVRHRHHLNGDVSLIGRDNLWQGYCVPKEQVREPTPPPPPPDD